MTFTVNSLVIKDDKSWLEPYVLERRDVLPDDVLIDITHVGICYSDIHIARNDWGITKYPLVPGHEIVGVVSKIGDKVTKHKVGDVVAVGCMVDSCGHCHQCEREKEQFCPEVTQTYNFPERRFPRPGVRTAGGYSEKIVVKDHFACKVPKELQVPELISGVAPIMCAGITTYSPMVSFGLNSSHKVAIVGLGGLGHMGVQIARAMGAEVTVISRSHKKDEKAKKLGATSVIASGSKEEMEANANQFDLIVDTVPFDHDINEYIPLLKPEGEIAIVGHLGILSKPINTVPLIMANRKIAGSVIGGIQETQDLLDLCAKHKIISEHKLIQMEQANEAWKELIDGSSSDSRYVIDVTSFRERNAKKN